MLSLASEEDALNKSYCLNYLNLKDGEKPCFEIGCDVC
ncbi:hypothetical protein MNV_1090016 [Candidatus Methanoperedens nitroreducens]|uniref:Uncharacterized protein n=1 Tax=Candidatus Methanoperedens nitratireducens TaxID=1392998 RepID=A0A284VIT6_9EURY|nr:hypothetical protein MNV_1090016 [Candidatus Methanoperedens nitroreducens]